MTSQTVPGL